MTPMNKRLCKPAINDINDVQKLCNCSGLESMYIISLKVRIVRNKDVCDKKPLVQRVQTHLPILKPEKRIISFSCELAVCQINAFRSTKIT